MSLQHRLLTAVLTTMVSHDLDEKLKLFLVVCYTPIEFLDQRNATFGIIIGDVKLVDSLAGFLIVVPVFPGSESDKNSGSELRKSVEILSFANSPRVLLVTK